ncbi:MAG TPA: sugar transferase [Microthrixaceae bacterium]|nr:sugar transferase [Microthrixaceae bacterium]
MSTLEQFHSMPEARARSTSRHIQRAIDVVGASVALLVCSPLLLFAIVAIRITSRGPALFRQVRIGAMEEPFTCIKLRTMYANSDDDAHRRYVQRLFELGGRAAFGADEQVFKLADDPRITPVGRWLRRTSLDELPQLWNVLRGEMSLVGPRPMLPFELELLEPWQRERFRVRPGLTGLWQVSGRSRIPADEGMLLDVQYARTRDTALDLRILARTPKVLLHLDETG